jgi:hypothetical protein
LLLVADGPAFGQCEPQERLNHMPLDLAFCSEGPELLVVADGSEDLRGAEGELRWWQLCCQLLVRLVSEREQIPQITCTGCGFARYCARSHGGGGHMAKDAFGDETTSWGASPPPARAAAPQERQWGASSSGGFEQDLARTGGGWTADANPLAGTHSQGVTAPWPWLAAAASCGVIALLLAAGAAERPLLSVAGWLVGGFIAVGLVAAFTLADSRRRADPWYTPRAQWDQLRVGVLGLAVLAVLWNAWAFADWVSRQ